MWIIPIASMAKLIFFKLKKRLENLSILKKALMQRIYTNNFLSRPINYM